MSLPARPIAVLAACAAFTLTACAEPVAPTAVSPSHPPNVS